MVPGRTVDVKGRKAVQVRTTGAEKGDLTAVLSCTANGDMLPPMMIFKVADLVRTSNLRHLHWELASYILDPTTWS